MRDIDANNPDFIVAALCAGASSRGKTPGTKNASPLLLPHFRSTPDAHTFTPHTFSPAYTYIIFVSPN